MRARSTLSLLLMLITLPLSHASASIVISELLWSGTGLSTADEYLELTNTASGAIDISNWTLTKLSSGEEVDMLSIPEGTVIDGSGTFLIANYSDEDSRLSIDANLIENDIALSNTKLLIRLYKPDTSSGASATGRILMDAVDDGVGKPFAGSNDAPKASMERIDPTASGQLVSNWRTATTFLNFDDGAKLFGTPGEMNGTGPSEDIFAPAEATLFNAEFRKDTGSGALSVSWVPSTSLDLASQELTYSPAVNGGSGMTLAATASGVTFTEDIGDGLGFTFTLKSTDDSGNTSTGVTVQSTLYPHVKITEVLANPAGKDDEEWIEIGNLGPNDVDISGWILDEGNSSDDFTISESEPLLLSSGAHLSFPKSVTGLPLDNKGEKLTLARGGEIMDTWEYTETAEEVSYGRLPEDQESFGPFCVPTEGLPNEVIPQQPFINIQSGPDPNEDGSVEQIQKLTLNLEATVFTGSIKHGSCLWDYSDGFTSESCNPPSHTFDEIGEYPITLIYTNFCSETLTGTLIARVLEVPLVEEEKKTVTEKKSSGGGGGSRGGGGGGGGRIACTPEVFSGIRISEFMPNPVGKDEEGEWIELRNENTQEVSLCGWVLDDAEKGSKPHILDEYRIAGKGTLLLPRPQTKIALNNSNEHVRLFAPKNELIEDIAYEKSTEGESFALRSDNLMVWTPFPTPGEENRFRTAERRYPDQTLVVSAAYPNPEGRDDGKEWIEVTNVGEKTMDLAGWIIDDRDGSSDPYVIESGTLDPGDVRRFTVEETDIQLTNLYDEARLLDPDRFVVSLLSWNVAISGMVYRPFTPGETEEALVVAVIDGDTIEVEIDGTRHKVRLIGVDTPETVHPLKAVEKFGKEASDFTRSQLEGKTVTLQYGEERYDKYKRYLAYVILGDGTNFNGELIRRGFAHAYLRFPFELEGLFAAYEAEARKAKLGLWADEEVTVVVDTGRTGVSVPLEEAATGSTLELITEEEGPPVQTEEDEDETESYSIQVLFSEVMSNPPKEGPLHDTGEYIELYNPEETEIDLTGWILDDNPAGSSKPQTLSGILIASNSYITLTGSALKVSLNNDGEELSLTAPDGSVFTAITYPEMKRGEAYAMNPRSDDWCVSRIATPGEVNVCRRVEEIIIASNKTTKTVRAVREPPAQNIHKDPLSTLRKKYRPILAEHITEYESPLPNLLSSITSLIRNTELPPTLVLAGPQRQRKTPLGAAASIGALLSIAGTAFTRKQIASFD